MKISSNSLKEAIIEAGYDPFEYVTKGVNAERSSETAMAVTANIIGKHHYDADLVEKLVVAFGAARITSADVIFFPGVKWVG